MTKKEQDQGHKSRTAFFSSKVRSGRQWNRRSTGLILLFAVGLLLTLIIVPKGGFIPDYYAPGDIASRDIKSPRDLLLEDKPLTASKREEARTSVLPLYDYDSAAGRLAAERFIRGLTLIQQQAAEQEMSIDPDVFRAQVEEAFGLLLAEGELQTLRTLPLDAGLIQQLGQILKKIFARPIVANRQLFDTDLSQGIVVRNLQSQTETTRFDITNVAGLEETLKQGQALLKEIQSLSVNQRETLLELMQQQLRPSLTFNQQETETRRLEAWDQVTPVLFQIKKGEMIVREGERVTLPQISKLRALRDLGRDDRGLQTAFGLLVCIVLLIYAGYHFSMNNIRKFRPDSRDLFFLSLVFLGLFVLIKIAIFVATGLESTFAYIDSSSYYYAIPFALGAMLVRIVLNSESALIFSICCSLLVGILFGNSLVMALYVLASSLVGAHGVRHCKERSTLYRAGFWVALTNGALLIGIHFMAGRTLEIQLAYKLCMGLFGGLFSAMFVNGIIPLIESGFKYTTDVKLLELANMNSPVLRELMIQAPGTYHHSIVVGNLVEVAAEAINANPLLARVAAYYHDIGKIKKPLYFIENSDGQRNRHDKLAPSMSALILTSHVKDGVELAREHKLGKEIIDIIQQHHGTALIKFFYDRAKNQANPGVQQIDERDYRYHGPKPQTREAALIMLADAIEAASKTLTNPTQARIQGMVQKLINNVFIDGQLDECELTLKDLHLIAKSFNMVLAGTFHHRIDYPEPVHIEREKEPESSDKNENTDRKPAKEAQDSETSAEKDSPEDLKRLGMS
ncbi:MAG TPA: HDIG domain-containing protein [Geopsychrobacteraceae bacterium]|nr:HDIG domain-containing protein [Geopsychrobacteraceae bacterium]